MKVMIEMNDIARVILTEDGARVLNIRDDSTKDFSCGDTYETEIWKLMQIFGPSCRAGESLFRNIEVSPG
jgi:hypothetical protein